MIATGLDIGGLEREVRRLAEIENIDFDQLVRDAGKHFHDDSIIRPRQELTPEQFNELVQDELAFFRLGE